MNVEKTQILILGRDVEFTKKVKIEGKETEKVEFCYLGSKIITNGKIHEEIGQRILKRAQFYHLVRDGDGM